MSNQVPLHQFVARTLVRRVLQFALLVAIYFVTAWALPHLGVVDSMETPAPGELNIVQPAEPSKAERLLEKHDCWTGRAPTSAGVPDW